MYLEKKKNAIINAVQSGGRLPAEFQEVEWIGGTGKQYLQINSAPLKADYIETEVACEFIDNDDYLICGYPWNNNNNRFAICGRLSNKFHYAFGGEITASPPYMATSYNYDFHNWVYNNGVFEIVDRSDIVNVSNRAYGDDNSRKIQIFRDYRITMPGKIKTFIQERNGEQIVNLVPCYRKSDDEIGMYDTVTQTFYTNAGTGTFIKGGDV